MTATTGSEALERLGDAPYVSLATWRKNGKEVRTPVWVARADDRLYVFTEGTAGKVKRLRNDPHVRVAPCDVHGRVHGDWHEGRGRIVEDAATEEAAYAALLDKYGWQMRLANFFSRLTGRIDGRAVLEIALDETAGKGAA